MQYLGQLGPVMEDNFNDMWALGVMIHEVLTCTGLNWETAFHPSMQLIMGAGGEPEVDIKNSIISKQALWVSACFFAPLSCYMPSPHFACE